MGHQTRSPREVHAVLRQHPNFVMPDLSDPQNPEAVAAWVLEAVASYVSPPKLDDEDDELACEDIAAAIRTRLYPEILAVLRSSDTPL